MRRKKRSLLLLIPTIISAVALITIVFTIPPSKSFSISLLHLPATWLFFISLALFCFFLPTFLLKSKKHGVLTALFVITYLFFRLSGLTHILFFVLLLGLFLTAELLFTSKRV